LSDHNTYTTVVEQMGARMEVAQELLRHPDIQTTMNIYTGAMQTTPWPPHSKKRAY